MGSFSWLYIGLGVILGFLFLGIVAELYYLLWQKKKRINNTTEVEEDDDDEYTNKPPLHLIIPSETNPIREIARNPLENRHGLDLELGCSEEMLLKTSDLDEDGEEEEEDLELMAIYNLAGQPRFLFTIKEETKEDLESEDARSRKASRNRSLSDIIAAIDQTPFFTPMASPPLKASDSPPLDPYNYKLHGFNPLFESSSAELLEQNLNRLRSSPPPKFKFLRDAEEKLYRRLMEETQRRKAELKNEQVIRKPSNQRSSSQVLPLVSSPPEFQTNSNPFS